MLITFTTAAELERQRLIAEARAIYQSIFPFTPTESADETRRAVDPPDVERVG